MKYITSLDGTRVKMQQSDFDQDGIVNEEETLKRSFDKGVAHISESTELKDAIQEFNKDEKNRDGLTTMDFMGRILNEYELMPLKAWDSLRAMRCISTKAHMIGRIALRKNIAFEAYGREGFKELVIGKKNQDAVNQGKVMQFTGMGESK